jgi:hypothetical protein
MSFNMNTCTNLNTFYMMNLYYVIQIDTNVLKCNASEELEKHIVDDLQDYSSPKNIQLKETKSDNKVC